MCNTSLINRGPCNLPNRVRTSGHCHCPALGASARSGSDFRVSKSVEGANGILRHLQVQIWQDDGAVAVGSGNVQQNIFSPHQLRLLFEWAKLLNLLWYWWPGILVSNRSPQWSFSFTCLSAKIGFGSKIMWGKAATCSIWSVAHPWACLELEKQVSLKPKQASNISTHLPWSSCLKNTSNISTHSFESLCLHCRLCQLYDRTERNHFGLSKVQLSWT